MRSGIDVEVSLVAKSKVASIQTGHDFGNYLL